MKTTIQSGSFMPESKCRNRLLYIFEKFHRNIFISEEDITTVFLCLTAQYCGLDTFPVSHEHSTTMCLPDSCVEELSL